jgi:hypothetical protein
MAKLRPAPQMAQAVHKKKRRASARDARRPEMNSPAPLQRDDFRAVNVLDGKHVLQHGLARRVVEV